MGRPQQDHIDRSNTTTTVSSGRFLWFGKRKDPSAQDSPAPPPDPNHIEESSTVKPTSQAKRQPSRPDLRASKLGTVEKLSAAERIDLWRRERDEQLTPLELWRQQVSQEVEQERKSGRARTGFSTVYIPLDPSTTSSMRAATEEIKQMLENSPPFSTSFTVESLALPPSPIQASTPSSIEARFFDERSEAALGAEGHPYALTRGIDRSTLLISLSPRPEITSPSSPETQATFFFPPQSLPEPASTPTSSTAARTSVALQPVPADLYRFPHFPTSPNYPNLIPVNTSSPPPISAFPTPSSAAPDPAPYTVSPMPLPSSRPFPDLLQVNPIPAATLTPNPSFALLPPKAAALLGLIPSATVPFSTHANPPGSSLPSVSSSYTFAPPRPRYCRNASIATSSAGSTATRSFWSGTAGNACAPLIPASRPSCESSTPTTTSPSTSKLSQELPRPSIGAWGRRRAPPPLPLLLRKEGMASLPDLHARSSSLDAGRPFVGVGVGVGTDLRLELRAAAAADLVSRDETESLVDGSAPLPRRFGTPIGCDDSKEPSTTRCGVAEEERSNVKDKGSGLWRSLSGGKGRFSRANAARMSKGAKGSVEEKKARRKTRDEWEMESQALAGRLRTLCC
ncbi:hypothetical protein JCM1840_006270 [Sporobolomyces johnsonii]